MKNETCLLNVYLKDSKGNQVPSILYPKLRRLAGSVPVANKLYNAITSESFKNSDTYDGIELDKNGEPTIESLYKIGLSKLLDREKICHEYERDLGVIDGNDNGIAVEDNFGDKMVDYMSKAVDFNEKHNDDGYCAVLQHEASENKVVLRVIWYDQKNKVLPLYKKKLEDLYSFSNRIRNSSEGVIKRELATDVFTSLAGELKFYNLAWSFQSNLIQDFSTSEFARNYLAALNLLTLNKNKRINKLFESSEVGANAMDKISSCMADICVKYMGKFERSSGRSYFDALVETLDKDECKDFLVGENGLITESQKASGFWQKKAVHTLVDFFLKNIDSIGSWNKDGKYFEYKNGGVLYNGIKIPDTVLEVLFKFFRNMDSMISSGSRYGKGILTSVAGENIDSFIEKIEYTESDLKLMPYKSAEDYKRFNENIEYLKKIRDNASERIEALEHYEHELNRVFQKMINTEFRRIALLREKKGISEIQSRFIAEDYQRTKELASNLNNARSSARISLSVYEYINSMSERISDLNNMLQEIRNGNYTEKQKMSIMRDVIDFTSIYKEISAGVRALMLDGDTFIQEVSSKSANDVTNLLPVFNEIYRSLANSNTIPAASDEMVKFVEEFNAMTEEEKIKNIPDLKDKLKEAIRWKAYNYMGNSELPDSEKEAKFVEDMKTLDSVSAVLEAMKVEDLRTKQEAITRTMDVIDGLVHNLDADFKNILKPLITKFLDAYFPDNLRKVQFGEYMGFKQGETISVETLLERVGSDINGYQKLFSSLTSAPDLIANLIGESIKDAKYRGSRRAQEDCEEIKREALLLEQAGITDTDWMFEVDENGNRTEFYVQSVFEKSAYDTLMQNKHFRDEVGLLPGESYFPDNFDEKTNAYAESEIAKLAQRKRNMNNLNLPDMPKLTESKRYLEIMANPAKKRFYQFFMKKYAILQSKYPPRVVVKNRIIGLRANEKEEGTRSGSLWESVTKRFNVFLDNFRTQYNDDIAMMKVDPEGREVKMLPIYFCNFKPEDISSVTHDCVAALMAYSVKAREYAELNQIVDSLEMTKELIKEREIRKTKGGTNVVDNLKRYKNAILHGYEPEYIYEKDGGKSNFFYLIENVIDMQLYGRFHDPAHIKKIFGKNINLDKAGDWLNKRTAEAALNFSLTNGISNVVTGSVLMHIETMAKRFFKPADLAWADKEYFLVNGGSVITQRGFKARAKTNKMLLLGDLYDVQHEVKDDLLDSNWSQNTFKRMFGHIGQVFQDAGEHAMAYRTALCVWHSTKVKDKTGKEIPLYDAYEVKFYDKNNNLVDTDQGLGAKVVLKEGITKLDGTAFTEADEYRISARISGINHGMHGIYNSEDANVIQKYVIGRFAYMFRKWIPEAIHKRFGAVQPDLDKGIWTEGYYRTMGRFAQMMYKDLREGKLKVSETWGMLTEEEKRNIFQGLREIGAFTLVAFIAHAFFSGKIDDDDDEWYTSYMKRMLHFQIWRLYSELGFLVPGPMMAKEFLRIFKSPAACINIIDSLINLWKLVWIPSTGVFDGYLFWDEGEHTVKRGFFKGHSEWMKAFLGNRALFPKLNVIISNTDGLEELERQYKK